MTKFIDSLGLSYFTSKIKDGTIVAGKANQVPASGITGVIPIEHIPQDAQERLIKVANQAARFKLTVNDVQLGDTVQDVDTGLMWFVIDTSKLNSADGYQEYTAGKASSAAKADSVEWSGITNIPNALKQWIVSGWTNIRVDTGNGNTLVGDVTDVQKGKEFVLKTGNRVHTISLGGTKKTVDNGGELDFSTNELATASMPYINYHDMNDVKRAPQGLSILYDLDNDKNKVLTGFMFTNRRDNVIDQLAFLYQGINFYVSWGSYVQEASPNFSNNTVDLFDTSLSNTEIDAAIAAAK